MSTGVLRWRDLQNIFVTEEEINRLTGLTVTSEFLNKINGLEYTGAEINSIFTIAQNLQAHLLEDLTHAHQLVPNSLDGMVLSDSTVGKGKLSFSALDTSDKLELNTKITSLEVETNSLSSQIDDIYSIIIPGQASDIADSINQMVHHIEKTHDAHDASAISYGNYYSPVSDSPSGTNLIEIPLSSIQIFRAGDSLKLESVIFGPETVEISSVDYDTGIIELTSNLIGYYRVSDSFIIYNLSEENVQTALDRSLKNHTDIFRGRLQIVQEAGLPALEIKRDLTQLYGAYFNDFTAKTDQDFLIELGENDGTSVLEILNSDRDIAFRVRDDGEGLLTTLSLQDKIYPHYYGKINKLNLSQDQEWIFPDKSGMIAIGDIAPFELLKVSKTIGDMISVAPGFMSNQEGEIISSWLNLNSPSRFAGQTFSLSSRLASDSQLTGLASNWQAFTIYLTDTDVLSIEYGPKRPVKVDAISDYNSFIPSAYMKLAKIIFQGNGAGGILFSSIEILEDTRPFLTLGMANAFYDERLSYPSGLSIGSIVNLPLNTRANNSPITYRVGVSQLEVYLDGIYQQAGIDYTENSGNPARIQILKDLNTDSVLRFRITYNSAAVTGGIVATSLQSAYEGGQTITTSSLLGPVKISSFEETDLLEVDGNVEINGNLKGLNSIQLEVGSSLDPVADQIFLSSSKDLIFRQNISGDIKDINLTKELNDLSNLLIGEVENKTGADIPSFTGLVISPLLPNHVLLTDTSNSLITSDVDCIALESIPNNGKGRALFRGKINTTLTIPHSATVVVDPRNPGLLVDRSTVTWLPSDKEVVVGKMDGQTLLFFGSKSSGASGGASKTIRKAGETFNANETFVVRYGLGTETQDSVYKASKEDANSEQKFWAIGLVRPNTTINPGEDIEILQEATLGSSELSFSLNDIGKPFYLSSNGEFSSWSNLSLNYLAGDAIVKLGIIKTSKKIEISSIQMMGTANGAMI